MMNRFARVLATSGAVVGASLLAPNPAQAQAKFELIPFFASYYPLAAVNKFPGDSGGEIQERQFAAPSIGGRLRYWFNSKMGFEAAVSYTTSGTKFSSNDNSQISGVSLNGNILAANGRLLIRPPRTNFHFLVGAGIVKRGGDTWNFPGLDKLTNVTGVAGFGVHAAITPKFALDVGVEANLYSLDPDGSSNAFGYESRFQSDILLSIGVPISLGH